VGQPADLKGSKLDDSVARKVEMWRTKDGKEIGGTSIRNLLCTLHMVLWEGKNKPLFSHNYDVYSKDTLLFSKGASWKEVALMNVITPNDVKKNYQKAVRVVHPDRQILVL